MTGVIGVVLAGAGVLLVVVTLANLRSLRRSVDELGAAVVHLAEGAATIDDLRAAVADAVAAGEAPAPEPEGRPVTRVPQVLRTGPVIKAMALGSGTAHVARRLRGSGNGRN